MAMTERRPRSFLWVIGPAGPCPQIVFDDPRTGCGGLQIIRDEKLPIDDTRSLDELAADYPAPGEAA